MASEARVDAVALAYGALLIVAFLLIPHSRDFANYSDFCASQADRGFFAAIAHFDPAFTLSCYAVSTVSPAKAIFIVGSLFVAVGTYLKFFTFMLWKEAFWFILAIYVSRFYVLQDVTQLRAGLATGLLGTVFVMSVWRRYLAAALLAVACVLVHLSAVVMLPVIAVVARLNESFLKVASVSAVVVALGLYAAASVHQGIGGIGVASIEALADDNARLDFYLENSEGIAVPLYKNAYLIIKATVLGLFAVAASLSPRVFDANVYRATILSAIALAIAVVFYQNEVLSLRFAELLSLFDAVVIGWMVYASAREGVAGLVLLAMVLMCGLFLSRQVLVLV